MAVPLQEPKHVTSVFVTVKVIAGGCVIVVEKVAVQVLLSVTVIVTTPGHKFPILFVDEVEGVDEADTHEKLVYGGVPPPGTAAAEPLQAALQVILLLVPFATNNGGWFNVVVKVFTQPLLLVAVTVYVPAHAFFKVSLVKILLFVTVDVEDAQVIDNGTTPLITVALICPEHTPLQFGCVVEKVKNVGMGLIIDTGTANRNKRFVAA